MKVYLRPDVPKDAAWQTLPGSTDCQLADQPVILAKKAAQNPARRLPQASAPADGTVVG
jgi:hypothetical protein